MPAWKTTGGSRPPCRPAPASRRPPTPPQITPRQRGDPPKTKSWGCAVGGGPRGCCKGGRDPPGEEEGPRPARPFHYIDDLRPERGFWGEAGRSACPVSGARGNPAWRERVGPVPQNLGIGPEARAEFGNFLGNRSRGNTFGTIILGKTWSWIPVWGKAGVEAGVEVEAGFGARSVGVARLPPSALSGGPWPRPRCSRCSPPRRPSRRRRPRRRIHPGSRCPPWAPTRRCARPPPPRPCGGPPPPPRSWSMEHPPARPLGGPARGGAGRARPGIAGRLTLSGPSPPPRPGGAPTPQEEEFWRQRAERLRRLGVDLPAVEQSLVYR